MSSGSLVSSPVHPCSAYFLQKHGMRPHSFVFAQAVLFSRRVNTQTS